MDILKKIFSYTKKYSKDLAVTIIFAIIGVAGSLITPILTGKAIDYIIGKGNVDFKSVSKTLIILSLSVVISAFSQWIMTRSTNRLSYLTSCDIRKEFFVKLLKKSGK